MGKSTTVNQCGAIPPALVFGTGITSLAVIRALGRAGIPLLAVSARPGLERRSRWFIRASTVAPDPASGPENVGAYLRELPIREAVTFPASDDWAIALASLPSDLESSYRSTTSRAELLRVLIDKAPFAAAAERSGVPIPHTIPVDRSEDLAAVADGDLQRYFLKPRNSQRFNARHGVKGVPLRTREQARASVDRLAGEGDGLVLQEYIPGPATAHVFLDGYIDRTGRRRACLARRRLRMYPPRLGNSTLSETIAIDEVAPALQSLQALFDDTAYHGCFDAEFKYDARDARFKLLEINARPWWQFELVGACGLDVAAMAYRDAIGLPLDDAPPARPGVRWMNPGPDLRAWRAGRFRGPAPPSVFFGEANAVWSRDDPGPFIHELARSGARLLQT